MKTILIVDDDENICRMCEREFRYKGYVTHSVTSGAEALRFMGQNRQVSLVVLDINLVPHEGIEVLKEFRARNHYVPVILYSGYPIYRYDFAAQLADACLIKSSDLTELKEKVKELLGPES